MLLVTRRPGWTYAAVIASSSVLSSLYWLWFVRAEKTLYSWDHVAYWSMTAGLAERLFQQPFQSLLAVARSVAESELNLLPALPLAPVLAVFGDSRLSWILAVSNLYALPSLALGGWAVHRIVRATRRDPSGPSTATLVAAWVGAVLWLMPFWEPVALGYLGVGGVALAFVVYGLVFGPDACTRREADLQSLVIGLTLALLVLFRRWYAFWSLAFCLVLALDAIQAAWTEARKGGTKSVRHTLRRPVLVAAGLVTTLLALAAPRMVTIATTDYGDRFVHYDSLTTFSAEMLNVVSRFGVVALFLVAAGVVLGWQRAGMRRPVLLIVLHTVITALMFRQVQDPSPQHWYLVLPGLLVVLAIGLSHEALRGRLRTVIVGMAAFSAAGVLGLGPGLPAPLGSAVKIAPAVRSDLGEIEKLLELLDGRVQLGAQWIYVLSGTGVLSGSGLGFAEWSLGAAHPACSRILQTNQVDLRDGFPDGLFAADVVLLPVPIQVRGDGRTQRVITVPAEDFLEDQGIARAFARLPLTFELDGGVQVRVFERVRPSTPEEIRAVSDRLRGYYPNRAEVFTPAR